MDIDPGSESIGRAELVMVGTELLLGQIRGDSAGSEEIILEPELVVRESAP